MNFLTKDRPCSEGPSFKILTRLREESRGVAVERRPFISAETKIPSWGPNSETSSAVRRRAVTFSVFTPFPFFAASCEFTETLPRKRSSAPAQFPPEEGQKDPSVSAAKRASAAKYCGIQELIHSLQSSFRKRSGWVPGPASRGRIALAFARNAGLASPLRRFGGKFSPLPRPPATAWGPHLRYRNHPGVREARRRHRAGCARQPPGRRRHHAPGTPRERSGHSCCTVNSVPVRGTSS